MEIKVYHAKKGNFFAEHIPRNEYELVAKIDAEGLEDTFRLSQNINQRWTNNRQVMFRSSNELRSTSTGDVLEMNGKHFMVLDIGWDEIDFE